MPVQKFRTFNEAEKALWCFEPDEEYFRKLREMYSLARELNPIRYPQGVFKYRSIEEAQQQQREWEMEHARSLRKQRAET